MFIKKKKKKKRDNVFLILAKKRKEKDEREFSQISHMHKTFTFDYTSGMESFSPKVETEFYWNWTIVVIIEWLEHTLKEGGIEACVLKLN